MKKVTFKTKIKELESNLKRIEKKVLKMGVSNYLSDDWQKKNADIIEVKQTEALLDFYKQVDGLYFEHFKSILSVRLNSAYGCMLGVNFQNNETEVSHALYNELLILVSKHKLKITIAHLWDDKIMHGIEDSYPMREFNHESLKKLKKELKEMQEDEKTPDCRTSELEEKVYVIDKVVATFKQPSKK
jgi:hypothetical protein